MDLKIFDLGLVDFSESWQFQKEVFSRVKDNTFDSALVFCQHNPVITLGRNSSKDNILAKEEELENKGIKLFEVERGGDVTYHGPGQLTVYPIFNLNLLKKDLNWFLRSLEEVVLGLLADFGIEAERRPGLTGVWVQGKKLASIGIAVKNWITYHGLTVNIKEDDLANFSLIRPCGMDIMMTSLESVLGRSIESSQIKETLKRRIQDDQGCFAGIRRGD